MTQTGSYRPARIAARMKGLVEVTNRSDLRSRAPLRMNIAPLAEILRELSGSNPPGRRSVEQGRQRQDHRSVGRPRRLCGPHPLRPRSLRAGAELPPRRIISLTVARAFKDCVKEFHGFRQPTQHKGQTTWQSKSRK